MTNGDPGSPPAPEGVDLSRPNAARAYDYFLGGTSNWAIDREFGQWVIRDVWPQVVGVAQQNRATLRRFVRQALRAGIRQFIDLGSGIPTVGNVHHVVAEELGRNEYARVVYNDYEAVAVAHSQVLLEMDNAQQWAGVAQGDARHPWAVLDHEVTRRLIDFDQPVALLCVALLHFMSDDDDLAAVVRNYAAGLPAGSWIAFTHFTPDDADPDGKVSVWKLAATYTQKTSNPLFPRSLPEIEPWFALPGWKRVEPGFVHAPDWRPDNTSDEDGEDPRLWPYFWAGAIEKQPQ